MLTGKLTKLVHLSQQRYQATSRLVSDHNDKGYGFIADREGREVFFSHEVVANQHGFDALRLGQQLEYTLEAAPYLRAASVSVATAAPGVLNRPAA